MARKVYNKERMGDIGRSNQSDMQSQMDSMQSTMESYESQASTLDSEASSLDSQASAQETISQTATKTITEVGPNGVPRKKVVPDEAKRAAAAAKAKKMRSSASSKRKQSSRLKSRAKSLRTSISGLAAKMVATGAAMVGLSVATQSADKKGKKKMSNVNEKTKNYNKKMEGFKNSFNANLPLQNSSISSLSHSSNSSSPNKVDPIADFWNTVSQIGKNILDSAKLAEAIKNGTIQGPDRYGDLSAATEFFKNYNSQDSGMFNDIWIAKELPDIEKSDGTIKAHMDFRSGKEYIIGTAPYLDNTYTDEHGFLKMKIDGLPEDAYCVAMASAYNPNEQSNLGVINYIQQANGFNYYVICIDQKKDSETQNNNYQYHSVNIDGIVYTNIVEFVVDYSNTSNALRQFKKHGLLREEITGLEPALEQFVSPIIGIYTLDRTLYEDISWIDEYRQSDNYSKNYQERY